MLQGGVAVPHGDGRLIDLAHRHAGTLVSRGGGSTALIDRLAVPVVLGGRAVEDASLILVTISLLALTSEPARLGVGGTLVDGCGSDGT